MEVARLDWATLQSNANKPGSPEILVRRRPFHDPSGGANFSPQRFGGSLRLSFWQVFNYCLCARVQLKFLIKPPS